MGSSGWSMAGTCHAWVPCSRCHIVDTRAVPGRYMKEQLALKHGRITQLEAQLHTAQLSREKERQAQQARVEERKAESLVDLDELRRQIAVLEQRVARMVSDSEKLAKTDPRVL